MSPATQASERCKLAARLCSRWRSSSI